MLCHTRLVYKWESLRVGEVALSFRKSRCHVYGGNFDEDFMNIEVSLNALCARGGVERIILPQININIGICSKINMWFEMILLPPLRLMKEHISMAIKNLIFIEKMWWRLWSWILFRFLKENWKIEMRTCITNVSKIPRQNLWIFKWF